MKIWLTLVFFLTTSSIYGQYPFYSQYQFHGFVTNWNPSTFYYPGYIPKPYDFQPLDHTPENIQQYPEIFELEKLQKLNQIKAKRMFPELSPSRPTIENYKF